MQSLIASNLSQNGFIFQGFVYNESNNLTYDHNHYCVDRNGSDVLLLLCFEEENDGEVVSLIKAAYPYSEYGKK